MLARLEFRHTILWFRHILVGPTYFVLPRHFVTMADDHPPAPPAVATVLKLPPFWSADPALWFAQAEAQFATRHITTEITKFRCIVASLSPEVAMGVRDILIGAPPAQPYTTLRTALIARVGITEDARLQQLLEDEQLGDRRPSQLLRRMRQLLGTATMDDAILRRLFLRRLPTACRTILAGRSDITDLSDLADIADVATTLRPPLLFQFLRLRLHSGLPR